MVPQKVGLQDLAKTSRLYGTGLRMRVEGKPESSGFGVIGTKALRLGGSPRSLALEHQGRCARPRRRRVARRTEV